MARRGIEKLRTKVALAREVERKRLMKIDESEERQAKRDRHIDEIGQRREFKFTEAQWVRIAAEMPGAQVDQYRHDIEIAAAWLAHRRQNPELSPGRRTPKRDKRLSEKIETAALNLFLGLSELAGFSRMRLEGMFGAGRQGEVFVDRPQRLTAFKADVARIAQYAPYFLKAEQPDGLKLQGKADQARIVAWANATAWWEEATGKEATANPKSDAYVSREPDGPFVRFLQHSAQLYRENGSPPATKTALSLKPIGLAGKKKPCKWANGEYRAIFVLLLTSFQAEPNHAF